MSAAADHSLLALRGVSKQYRAPFSVRALLAGGPAAPTHRVLDGLSLGVSRGRITCLVGPNGSGKTTCLKLLAGVVAPTSGRVLVDNLDVDGQTHQAQRCIGYAPSDERSFYWRLSVADNLRFFGALHGLSAARTRQRTRELGPALALDELLNRPFRVLSAGQKARVCIARALLHRPRALLLDEVSRSLDPEATVELHHLVRQLVDDQGLAVLWATHDLVEAAAVADQIVLLVGGRMQACGPPAELEELTGVQAPAPPASPAPAPPPPVARSRAELPLQLGAFVRRDLLIESSYGSAMVFGFTARLLGVAVFFFLGRAVGDAAMLEPYGGDWFAFALLGLLAQEPLHAALSEMAAKVREAQLTGTLEAVLSTPVGAGRAIALSAAAPLLASLLRMLLLGGFAVGALGVVFDPGGLILALSGLALAVLGYAALGMLAASFTLVLKRGDPVASLVHVLSGLLAGVLYPVAVLPESLQAAAQLLPLTHALDVLRGALLPGAEAIDTTAALFRLALLCAAVVPLSALCFRAALARARADGSLTHF